MPRIDIQGVVAAGSLAVGGTPAEHIGGERIPEGMCLSPVTAEAQRTSVSEIFALQVLDSNGG